MAMEMDVREYTSPVGKLVRCFKQSRDNWKSKCQQAKMQNKLLQNQTRAVERSRELWRQRAQQQAQRIAELEQELEKIGAAAH